METQDDAITPRPSSASAKIGNIVSTHVDDMLTIHFSDTTIISRPRISDELRHLDIKTGAEELRYHSSSSVVARSPRTHVATPQYHDEEASHLPLSQRVRNRPRNSAGSTGGSSRNVSVIKLQLGI